VKQHFCSGHLLVSDSADGNGDRFLTGYNDSMIGYEKNSSLTSLNKKSTFSMFCCCVTVYMQVAALPYIQKAVATSRNKANRTLAFLEPWQIAACTLCVTLMLVWIFEFLFQHDESMFLACLCRLITVMSVL